MKNISIAVCMLCLLGTTVFAQEGKEKFEQAVMEEEMLDTPVFMSKGVQTSLSINLPGVRKSVVNRVWNSYAQTHFGSRPKYNRKMKTYVALQANAPALASGPVDLVSRTSQIGEDVAFSLSVNTLAPFMSVAQVGRKGGNAPTVLEDFALEVRREKIRMQIEDEEKNLRQMEGTLRQLKNANLRYHKEIELAQQRILRAKENIQQNEKDQVTAADQIKAQHKLLDAVKKQLSQL